MVFELAVGLKVAGVVQATICETVCVGSAISSVVHFIIIRNNDYRLAVLLPSLRT